MTAHGDHLLILRSVWAILKTVMIFNFIGLFCSAQEEICHGCSSLTSFKHFGQFIISFKSFILTTIKYFEHLSVDF